MESYEIKALRERLSLTQAGLARLMSSVGGHPVSRRTVEQWEQDLRGVGQLNRETLDKIAAAKTGDAIHAMLPNGSANNGQIRRTR